MRQLYVTSASIGLTATRALRATLCGRPVYARHALHRARGRSIRGLSPSTTIRSMGDRDITNFMFATGIENSIPTINGGRTRVDQMEIVRLLQALAHRLRLRRGSRHPLPALRSADPHAPSSAPTSYDWEFADLTFADLKRRGITPIVDLCHFGVPDWIGNFQNPDFPELFADYAGAFAERYPWIQLYTPVNEMFICAIFSAKYGWWNEQLQDRPRLRHRAQEYRQGERPGDDRDLEAAAPTPSSSRANRRNISTPTAPARSAPPKR